MNIYKVFILSLLCIQNIVAQDTNNRIAVTLDKYKSLLDSGTYQANCLQKMAIKPQSRYYTFKKAFEHFERYQGRVIVELGTTRSFVDGMFPGCNSDDIKYWEPTNPERWDWGAGCFTRVAMECLAHLNPMLHTIDICPQHIQRCSIITREFKHLMRYHVCSSEQFLAQCKPESIDLLYMDTGYIDEETAQLHLREAQLIVANNVLSKQGIILIDDVKNFLPGDTSNLGKAKYSIPYLLKHGFEVVENEYQVILKRSSSK